MQINLDLLTQEQKQEFLLFKDNEAISCIEQFVDGKASAIFFLIGIEAYFGFCSGDLSDSFIKAAKAYRCEHGIDKIVGPLNFSTYNTYRLKQNEDLPHHLMEPPYDKGLYDLLNANGEVFERYVTYEINDFDKLLKWSEQFAEIDDSAMTHNYELKVINGQFWLDNLERFYKSADQVFGENIAYSSISFETFKLKYGAQAATLICPHTSRALISKEDNSIIGIILNFVDPTALNTKRLLIKTMGVHPDHRHMGLSFIYLLKQIIPQVRSQYDQAYLCLMRDGNLPSLFAKDISQKTRYYHLFNI
ncbi:hypothetical protein M902_1121 [Bacteriovorax sp. BAL6_X]|uniref:hypothetical protein n=1 Tax=Bacteriovorax sp. BAL6_X TaxID=1201290 RepID=UPI000385F671|nr:hypothetical protein [Bacteriovorax sp. BAL6_X]EPZ49826.1 hypothetical protein M902_1121 [Bacteriovorax sp. BAL6_X]